MYAEKDNRNGKSWWIKVVDDDDDDGEETAEEDKGEELNKIHAFEYFMNCCWLWSKIDISSYTELALRQSKASERRGRKTEN